MKAFAAAGIIAAATAASSEANPTSSFLDNNQYYSYGYYNYAYPEYDHKEELTPKKVHHKKASSYRTNNIDIFAHSSSDEEEHHGYGHHDSHSDSHSDTSEDEHKAHKKHMIFLTGEGPDGDHCHEGDYCGPSDSASDYTDSDYQTAEEESSESHKEEVDTGCGGRRCARVDFDWNFTGLDGTMDIYQPYGSHPELLFDADFDGLTSGGKHDLAIMSLPKYTFPYTDGSDKILSGDSCQKTGTTLANVGTAIGDKYGNGSLRAFSDELCLDDFIGNAVEIRGTYRNYGSTTQRVLACGNVVEVPCPPRQSRW